MLSFNERIINLFKISNTNRTFLIIKEIIFHLLYYQVAIFPNNRNEKYVYNTVVYTHYYHEKPLSKNSIYYLWIILSNSTCPNQNPLAYFLIEYLVLPNSLCSYLVLYSFQANNQTNYSFITCWRLDCWLRYTVCIISKKFLNRSCRGCLLHLNLNIWRIWVSLSNIFFKARCILVYFTSTTC